MKSLICFYLPLISGAPVFSDCINKEGAGDPGKIIYIGEITDFSDVGINTSSSTQTLTINGIGLNNDIVVTVTGDFKSLLTGNVNLRSFIEVWGHATPSDPDGRPCAEWCFRTNKILINGVPKFTHVMNGCGCSTNAVHPQGGNWAPDRAGWCPGMEVPVRTDIFESSVAGTSFSYQYQLVPWTNDFKSTADNQHAYYAISSFVVAKSNTNFATLPVVN